MPAQEIEYGPPDGDAGVRSIQPGLDQVGIVQRTVRHPRWSASPASTVQRRELQGETTQTRGPTLAEIDRMSENELKAIVYGRDGYERFDAKGKPGPGHDGKYTHEQWQRASDRLGVIGNRKRGGGGQGVDDPFDILSPQKRGFEKSTKRKEKLSNSPTYQKDLETSQRLVNNRKTSSAKRAQNRVDAAEKKAFADNHPGGLNTKDKTSKDYLKSDVSGDVVRVGDTLWDASVWSSKRSGAKGPLGSVRDSQHTALGTSGSYTAGASAGRDGVTADAGASAQASLYSFKEELQWYLPDIEVMGETTNVRLFVNVAGMVGVEAKAKLEARAKKLSPKEPRIDPKALTSGIDLGAGASAEAFAGAKLSIGAGAVYDWKKKDESAYTAKLEQSAAYLLDTMTRVNPALGWSLRQLGAKQAARQLLAWLFTWGAQGNVTIVGVESMVEGSAGAGAKIHGSGGFKNGKLELTYGASATWGLGLGGQVKLTVDAVEGMKFALIVGGELEVVAKDWAMKKISRAVSAGLQMGSDLWNSFSLSGDNRAREIVRHEAHTLMTPKDRARLVKSLAAPWYSDDDQTAALTIMEYSARRGDARNVIAHLGGAEKAADMLLTWRTGSSYQNRMRKIISVK